MLLAFQILMFVSIVIFGMGAIGERDNNHKLQFTSITIASILALVFSFYIVG